MTNLDLKKAANDLALTLATDTTKRTAVETDTMLAAKATELALTDAQYNSFKASVGQFRGIYAQAVTQDAQAAAPKAPISVLKGTAPVPAAPSNPTNE